MEYAFMTVNQFLNRFFAGHGNINPSISAFFLNFQATAAGIYTLVIRWILPVLSITIFIRCILPLLNNRKRDTPWGYLDIQNGDRIPLMHWENSIGRSKLSDVVLNLPFISRSHAVLAYCGGDWSITDLSSKAGVQVNGKEIKGPEMVRQGDVISLGELNLTLLAAEEGSPEQTSHGVMAEVTRFSKHMTSGFTLFLIVLFQIFGGLQLYFSMGGGLRPEVPVTFFLFIFVECLHFFINRLRGGMYFELELLAYFLCGVGLFVVASASPGSLYKQLVAILIGVAAFSVLVVIIRDLDRAQKLKNALVAAALVLLALNLAIGETRNGAKNWIDLSFITFQPMEFVKIAFVLAGAATLDRLLTTRNLTSFIAFSGACIGTLAITKDFGTALIFFCAFLVIAFMRSGDVRTIALISAGALLGGIAVISFMPYVTSRFSVWGHVWQYADTSGFQQTRTMIAAASGGLLGVGGGKGYLVKIAAADTDLVFGVICEEWGLIIALTAVLIIVFFVFFAMSSVRKCRSSFYSIAACGAASIFLMQTALNVFGSVDFLPLTGVTMPFVSNGGSSIIACWCLLAFIKSVGERYESRKKNGKSGKSADSQKGWII
jgi:cell division protein FtsW